MKFLAGILFGMFSIILILVQGLFITWQTAYPEGLFYFTTIASIVITIILLIKSKSKL